MNEGLILDYSEGLTKKQKRVFEVLVCPIVASKSINDICLYKNHFGEKVILSSQEYGHTPDEDMCDLAIGFYEILYGFERGYILAQSKPTKEWQIAGDTMNSYETVSKFASEEKRKDWNESYHCLANFWILPSKIGRSNTHDYSKGKSCGKATNSVDNFNKGRRDYMDRFLECLLDESNLKNFKDEFKIYSDSCGNDFKKSHFIKDLFEESGEIKSFSKIKDDSQGLTNEIDGVINLMENNICKRAVSIVKNEEKCNQLFYYFKKLKIIG